MADPAALTGSALNCLGVHINVNIPPVTLPKIPSLPGIPTLPSIVVPGLAYSFQWPPISMPGFPTIIMGFLGSMLAGVNYTLGFLPPDIHNLPTLPTLDLFIKGFTGAAIGLPSLPAMNLAIPGMPSIPFPGMPGIPMPPGFDPSAMLNMIGMFIVAPFILFKKIITSILSLSLVLPTLPDIIALLSGICLSVGFPAATTSFIIPCVAKAGFAALSVLG